MKCSNRRQFLRNATIGGASAAASLTAAGLSPRRIYADSASGFNRIVYREFGSTGRKVSEVGFGAMNMDNPDLIHAAIDSGINYLDTAHVYMNGRNEEVVGRVMKDRRDEVFLTTKVPHRNPSQMPVMMETSLKRLQTDHVDLMLLHVTNSRDQILNEDFIRMFEDARAKGICTHIGVSTHANQAEVLDAAVESGVWEAVLVGYNYFSPPEVGKAIERARKAGLGIIGMKNLLNPAVWPWEPLEDIREDKDGDISASQALIKWVIEDPYVDTTIPGVTSFEQLAENVAIMGMPMTFGERRTLYKFGENIKQHYCRGVAGCTGCLEQCPKGVQVCDLNRCVNYAYGYGNVSLAWENYRELPESSKIDVCKDCGECTVKCVNGLNLTQKINQAKELFG